MVVAFAGSLTEITSKPAPPAPPVDTYTYGRESSCSILMSLAEGIGICVAMRMLEEPCWPGGCWATSGEQTMPDTTSEVAASFRIIDPPECGMWSAECGVGSCSLRIPHSELPTRSAYLPRLRRP